MKMGKFAQHRSIIIWSSFTHHLGLDLHQKIHMGSKLKCWQGENDFTTDRGRK